MASILLMSVNGDGVPLLLKMAQQGHVAKGYIQDQMAKRSLLRFRNPSMIGLPKMLEQYDIILFDMVGMGEKADEIKQKGYFVLGGGVLNDNLEFDRDYANKVAKKLLNLKIPESTLAKTPDEAKSYLAQAEQPLVLKPLNNQLPRLTLVSKTVGNEMIKSLIETQSGKLLPCIIQNAIDGIEISTEGWFDGDDFVCFNHTIEYKRLMEGNQGPQTGCMGNVVWKCQEDKLVQQAILPLKPLLQKAQYVGPIDVNSIVTENDAYFLEFTTRFGYDAIQAFCELMKEDLFSFLWRVVSRGKDVRLRDHYAIAVRMSMPPYPNSDEEALKQLEGLRVVQIPKNVWPHVYLSDVMRNEKDEITMAGIDGVVGCCTARGETIQEVRRRAYRTLKNISLTDDIQYRKDIGAHVEAKISDLKQWGWLDA